MSIATLNAHINETTKIHLFYHNHKPYTYINKQKIKKTAKLF